MSAEMDPERYEKVSLLLTEFLELETSEWQRRMAEAEESDPGIGKDLARMIEAHENAGAFLDDSVDLMSLADEFLGLFDPDDPYGLIGTTLDDTYDVDCLIGRGGMGAVYRARHVRLPKTVAIKVIPEHLASRVALEGEAGVRIGHPAVVAIVDLRFLPSRDVYFVMDYVEGHSLREEMKRHRRMRIDETVEIVSQVASALDAAQGAGFVHRDIKPENILLADGASPSSRVRVIDFGIAGKTPETARSREMLSTGLNGTPAYMSPEQWLGNCVIDQRTDVYSLGVVTFEMLTGRRPALGSFEEIQAAVASGSIASLEEFAPEVPAPIRLAITRALSVKPDARFPTAGGFAASLRGEAAPSVVVRRHPEFEYGGLAPVDRIDVGHGGRSIEFYQGDLLAMPRDWDVDILVVSAAKGSYLPTHGTLIEALARRGVVVSELAKRKVVDLREFSVCWLSRELSEVAVGIPARRILLFEPPGVASPSSRIDDMFRSLVPLLGSNERPATVAMSLVGAGGRRGALRNLVGPLVRSAVRWLESDLLNVGRLLVVERSEEKARELRALLKSMNASDPPRSKSPKK